jgi:hypothetical protein
LLIFFIISAVSALLWLTTAAYDNYYVKNSIYTLIAFAVIYLVFKIALEEIVSKRLKEARSRYSFRKILSILNIVGFVVAGIAVWVKNTQTLMVSYGLVAAGIAVGLQYTTLLEIKEWIQGDQPTGRLTMTFA